ncbi:hypothetical protein BDF20DRAFT_866051 [Mycotypha africana]|uniref:uncharacterized protein n=1 Tax=Mycotypha africana TaxID=64632 RepID=UPI0023017050|nr:uncharacterized protein BDF20DRAFT_866051 [Mycotypha africana]KAI8982291.1 hypothetical protein BDF20DRAFT_866051 [Mycotypha africana]
MFQALASKRLLRSTIKLSYVKYSQPQHRLSIRTYIRPHYYTDVQNTTLSKALQKQRDPIQRFNRQVNNLDPNKVLWTVIGTNVGVFLMWQYAYSTYRTFGDGHWLQFMTKHFAVSPEATSNGRYHTLLASCFSHQQLDHLAINMLVLHSMGQGVLQAIGVSRFLLLYASAGIVSNLIGNGYKKYVRPWLERNQFVYSRRKELIRSVGASGSIMGLITFFACACMSAPLQLIDVYKATEL